MGGIRRTAPRTHTPNITQSYSALSQVVRESGLLARTPWFYGALFGGLVVALVAAGFGFWLLGDSWFQLLIAGALGIIFTQFAFLAHEAAHRQVFASGPRNDLAGRLLATLFVGMSYQWWMRKHTRHHANPNRVGKDPDIEFDTISFTEESAARQRGVIAWITRRQGYLFFPLLTLEGLNLHATSVRGLFARRRVEGRALELALIAVRFAAYLGVVFWFLPLGVAFAFLGVQLAVFGIYMGASFAPNHKGMPIVPRDAKLDFFSKQVRTSRNISGGWWASALMGGLNYQVEHHLWPDMPSNRLPKVAHRVEALCERYGIPYNNARLGRQFGTVVRKIWRYALPGG